MLKILLMPNSLYRGSSKNMDQRMQGFMDAKDGGEIDC